jgi:hypothetical protein
MTRFAVADRQLCENARHPDVAGLMQHLDVLMLRLRYVHVTPQGPSAA